MSASFYEELYALMTRSQEDVFTACSLCVYKRQAEVVSSAWGEVEGTPATPETLFDLASITKLFTTTAFLSLVSEGRVTLETPLIDVIPEFGRRSPRAIDGGRDPHSKAALPTAAHLRGQSVDPSQVTFFHLLTHTSGLAAWRDVYNAVGNTPTPPDQPDSLSQKTRWSRALAALVDYPFVDQPGVRVIYSDLGLMLLGEAVARLHGAPLDEAIENRVLRPLMLTELYFNPIREHGLSRETIAPTELDETWRKRRIWGEVHDENASGVGGIAGHAGLFGTAQALAQFGNAWEHQPEIFGLTADLAAAAKQEQIVSQGLRRGLGFVLRAYEGASTGDHFSLNTYGHTGFTGTTLWIDPDHDLVVALLTNNVYFGRGKDTVYPFRQAVHDLIARTFNSGEDEI